MAEVSSWLTERLKLQVSAESEGVTFLGSADVNSGHGGREGVELVCRPAD